MIMTSVEGPVMVMVAVTIDDLFAWWCRVWNQLSLNKGQVLLIRIIGLSQLLTFINQNTSSSFPNNKYMFHNQFNTTKHVFYVVKHVVLTTSS